MTAVRSAIDPLIQEQLAILRRSADRGLALAQRRDPGFIDIFQHLLDEIERTGVILKNSALKTQLEGLRDIGLDRVSNAVSAVFDYVDQLEQDVVYGTKADREQIAQLESSVTLLEQGKEDLKEQNRLLRAELTALQNAIANPTPADAVPSP